MRRAEHGKRESGRTRDPRKDDEKPQDRTDPLREHGARFSRPATHSRDATTRTAAAVSELGETDQCNAIPSTRVLPATQKREPEEPMILTLVMATIVIVGLIAIAFAEPRRNHEIAVWSDEVERHLLHDGKYTSPWW